MIQTAKFYLFDVGVANHLARRRPVPGSHDFGKAFEHWVLMELMNYRRYRAPDLEIRFWRTSTGHEVDFVLDDLRVAIEVKGSARVHDGDLRGLQALCGSHAIERALLVSLEKEPRRVADGIEVLPWRIFLDRLWSGALV